MSLWLIDIIALLPTKWQNWILPPSSIPVVENIPDKVQLSGIAHVYVEHADLESFTKFAKDFGFVEARDRQSIIVGMEGTRTSTWRPRAQHEAPGSWALLLLRKMKKTLKKQPQFPGLLARR